MTADGCEISPLLSEVPSVLLASLMMSSGWSIKLALPKMKGSSHTKAAQFWKCSRWEISFVFQGLWNSSCTEDGNSRVCSETSLGCFWSSSGIACGILSRTECTTYSYDFILDSTIQACRLACCGVLSCASSDPSQTSWRDTTLLKVFGAECVRGTWPAGSPGALHTRARQLSLLSTNCYEV